MTYTIFKGWHFSLPPFPIFFYKKKVWERTIRFDSSFFYEIGENQKDIHKLWGVCWGSVHKNSCRFGARYVGEGMIELLAYCYENGVRLNTNKGERSICRIEANKYYKTKIKETATDYMLTVQLAQDSWATVWQPKTFQSPKFGFYCRPYFGGNVTAPHKIKIKVDS